MREQGYVKGLPPGKRFGFIGRPTMPGQPDPEDVFFLYGDYPKGQTPTGGDQLEFEVTPGAKGPKAKDITVLTKVIPGQATPPATQPSPAATPVVALTHAASAPQPSSAASQIINMSKTAPALQAASSGHRVDPVSIQAPEPPAIYAEFHYDSKNMKASAEVLELEVIIKVTDSDDNPVRDVNVELFCNGEQVQLPAPSPYTNKYGEAPFQIIYYQGTNPTTGLPGPPVDDMKLALAAKLNYRGQHKTYNEIAPRGQFQTKAAIEAGASSQVNPATDPSKDTVNSSPQTQVVPQVKPTAKAIKAQLFGLIDNNAIGFRINTLNGTTLAATGVGAEISIVTDMNLELESSPTISGPYKPVKDGLSDTGNSGVCFVKARVKPGAINGDIQFIVKGTDLMTEQIYIKTSLAKAARV